MSKKTHQTALGVPFDMNSFRTKNERVRAVGNMNVNARGDILDSNNNIIQNRNKVVNKMYERVMQTNPKLNRTPKSPPPVKNNLSPDNDTTQAELKDLDDDIPNPKKD